MTTTPLWVAEHGAEYAVPDEITAAVGTGGHDHGTSPIEDHSWHNDTSPKFGQTILGGDVEVMLWVEHPDRREYSTEVRFNITVTCDKRYHADLLARHGIPDPDMGGLQSAWEGNDPADAVAHLRQTVTRIETLLGVGR